MEPTVALFVTLLVNEIVKVKEIHFYSNLSYI